MKLDLNCISDIIDLHIRFINIYWFNSYFDDKILIVSIFVIGTILIYTALLVFLSYQVPDWERFVPLALISIMFPILVFPYIYLYTPTVLVEPSNELVLVSPGFSELPTSVRIFRFNYYLILNVVSEPRGTSRYFMDSNIGLLYDQVSYNIDIIAQKKVTFDNYINTHPDNCACWEEEDLLNEIKTHLALAWKLEAIISHHHPSYVPRPELDQWTWLDDSV